MGRFVVRLGSSVPADVLFSRVLDLRAHDRVIPLTRVAPVPLVEGVVFTARTGLGPFAFDDVMEVTRWEPPTERRPGVAVLVKRGPLIGGRVRVEVRASAPGSLLVWEQELVVALVPSWLDPLVTALARIGYATVLGRLTRGRE